MFQDHTIKFLFLAFVVCIELYLWTTQINAFDLENIKGNEIFKKNNNDAALKNKIKSSYTGEEEKQLYMIKTGIRHERTFTSLTWFFKTVLSD